MQVFTPILDRMISSMNNCCSTCKVRQSISSRNNCRSLAGWLVGNWAWPAGSTVWTYHNDSSFGGGFDRKSSPTHPCPCDEGCSDSSPVICGSGAGEAGTPSADGSVGLSGALVSSNSFSLRFCTKSRSTFLEVLWNNFWRLGGATFTRLADPIIRTHRAHASIFDLDTKRPLDSWLVWVKCATDSASHRTVPAAHRSNSVTLRHSRLITVSQLRWVENAYNFVHFVKIESRTSASRKIDGKRLLRRLGLDLFMATTYFSTKKN